MNIYVGSIKIGSQLQEFRTMFDTGCKFKK